MADPKQPVAPRHEDSVSSEPPARHDENNSQNDKTSSRTTRPTS